MSCNDDVVVTDENRIYKAKLGNGTGNLRDLRIVMSARIFGIGNQSLERPMLHRFNTDR